MGDTRTWVAIDADTKLIPSYHVGKRDGDNASAFIADLASRLKNKIQLSTDGLRAYEDAMERAWGSDEIDYAKLSTSAPRASARTDRSRAPYPWP